MHCVWFPSSLVFLLFLLTSNISYLAFLALWPIHHQNSNLEMLSRQPGFLERYFICRSIGGHFSNGFHISVCLNKPVDDVILSNALQQLLVKNPIHCLNFFRKESKSEGAALLDEDRKANGNNFEARLVSQVLFEDVVVHHQLTELDSAYFLWIYEKKIPINVDKPTWMLVVNEIIDSKKQWLTFSSNHVFIDGNSGVNFMDDLVKELAVAETLPDQQLVRVLFNSDQDAIPVLPKASEDVVGLYRLPPWFTFKTIVQLLLLPAFLMKFIMSYLVPNHPNLYNYPIFNFHPVTYDNKSIFNHINISPEDTAKGLEYCRLNGVTMTPFIASCALKALHETLSPILGTSSSHKFTLVICGRRHYPELKNEMKYGLFISSSEPVVAGDETGLQTTKVISQKLSADLKSRITFCFASLLRLVNIWDFIQEKYDKKETRTTIEVSNVGLKKIRHSDWIVEDLIFSQGVGVTHITVSACSTPHGGMNLVVTNHESLHQVDDGSTMKAFYGRFKEKLENPYQDE